MKKISTAKLETVVKAKAQTRAKKSITSLRNISTGEFLKTAEKVIAKHKNLLEKMRNF